MSRQSNYRKAHESDETFTRAAWDTVRDTEITYRVEITWSIGLDAQKGVWGVMAVAWHMEDDRPVRAVARVTGAYPNSRASSLSAYLFSVANMLALQVDSARQSEVNNSRRGA